MPLQGEFSTPYQLLFLDHQVSEPAGKEMLDSADVGALLGEDSPALVEGGVLGRHPGVLAAAAILGSGSEDHSGGNWEAKVEAHDLLGRGSAGWLLIVLKGIDLAAGYGAMQHMLADPPFDRMRAPEM